MKPTLMRQLILAGCLLVTLLTATNTFATPTLSLAISPAPPGGSATATIGITDASDVEFYNLELSFVSGTSISLPASDWLARGDYFPSASFGPAPPAELNYFTESTLRNRIFLSGFKPTGTTGAVGTVSFQVNPQAAIGGGQVLSLSGEYYSKASQSTVAFAPFNAQFTVSSNTNYTLTTVLAGTGSGAVNSSPAGIACISGICSSTFVAGTQVSLFATSASNSVFSSWLGGCSNTTGDICSFRLNADTSVIATFDQALPVRVVVTQYASLLAAYGAAQDGSSVTIEAQAVPLTGDLNLSRSVAVTLKGGYDSAFKESSGFSSLQGTVTVGSGSLTVENVQVQ
jgi:List-Bact-rpt repeat protein